MSDFTKINKILDSWQLPSGQTVGDFKQNGLWDKTQFESNWQKLMQVSAAEFDQKYVTKQIDDEWIVLKLKDEE